MKDKKEEILPLYKEVRWGKKGWSVKSYTKQGVKHIGRYRTQAAANKIHETLINKTK
tara:strand:+ start:4505 stop:4675 length:171 start_codon:yes stop_codon:yes gene_type:complete